MGYSSDKMLSLRAESNKIKGKIELLEEMECRFKKVIEKHIAESNEYDGAGDVWVNAFALLEDLDLEEWNLKRNQKIVEGIEKIKKKNDVSKGDHDE